MKKQISKWFVFFAFIGIIVGVILSCRLYDDRIELSKNVVWRYYSINPNTILDSLERGNTDVFTLLVATPEGELPSPEKSVLWSEDDFFLVAKTIHEQIWNESLGDQNLYSVSFDLNCADVERGGSFSNAEFLSFKITQIEGEEEIRMEYWVSIYPSIDLVYVVEGTYQPNVNFKEPIAISQYQVMAGDALKIAEENGGRESRTKAGNNCKISVMTSWSDKKIWRVLYYPDGFTRLLEVSIDAQTGNYDLIYP